MNIWSEKELIMSKDAKKILYINACVRDNSRTDRLARAYLDMTKKNSEEILYKEIDINNLNLKPLNNDDIVKRDADIRNCKLDKEEYQYAKEFAQADIIVMAAPYWDASFPSALKVYIENVCVNSITFGYDDKGSPVKKCNAQKFVYITAAGGYVRQHPSVQAYIEELCSMFMIDDVKFYMAQGLDMEGSDVDSILNETIAIMYNDMIHNDTIQNVDVCNEKKNDKSICETAQQDRLIQQMRFIEEIDKEKLIGRQTYLADSSRKENDAEHAWHMAIMTVLLNEYANEKIDVLKTMTMLLIHDIVEIDAGDTYAYDEEAKKTQRERELAAADRIFGLLPADQAEYMRGLWDEFEARKTPEARFARTLDNVQPTLLNNASHGRSWAEKGVHLSQILKRNECTKYGSEQLWEYAYNNFIKPNVDAGHIKND